MWAEGEDYHEQRWRMALPPLKTTKPIWKSIKILPHNRPICLSFISSPHMAKLVLGSLCSSHACIRKREGKGMLEQVELNHMFPPSPFRLTAVIMLQIKKISAFFFFIVLGMKLPTASPGSYGTSRLGRSSLWIFLVLRGRRGGKKSNKLQQVYGNCFNEAKPFRMQTCSTIHKETIKKSVLYRLFYKKVIKTIVWHIQLHKQAHHGRCLCESRTMNT